VGWQDEAVALCRPIIVLGAERSGTSVCAEMIHVWGAYAGDPGELPAADELNPRGRWEYLPLWDLLAEVGEFSAGATWWTEDFPAKVAAKAADRQLAGRARALVARMAAPGRPWLWKDPALCHFLGFMMLSVLHAIDTGPATLFAEYEAVTTDPASQARRLSAFLDRQCATSSGEGTVATMTGVCEPGLRRNRSRQRREDLMTAPQRSLYRFLRQKVQRPRMPMTGDFPMPAGWRELIIGEEALMSGP